ncbi:MAG: aldo/keto reductase [Pirellulales bacterium]
MKADLTDALKIRRREFLESALVGTGGLLVGSRVLAAAEPAKPVDPTELVPLGKTKIKVSRIGLGTGMRGGNRQSNHTRMGAEKFDALVHHAYDQGIRLFDVADLYGTQPFLARALAKVPRENYVISTKMWVRGGGLPERERPDADVVVERFLKELKTDYIDLILMHCMTDGNWNKELRKQMDILEKVKEKGLIRAHGISCHSLDALETAITEPWIDSIHARINPYGVAMDDKPEKVVPVLKKLHEAGKGVVGMKVLGEGRFATDDEKSENSVRWIMGLGSVDTMIVGFEKPEQIDIFKARVRRALEAKA